MKNIKKIISLFVVALLSVGSFALVEDERSKKALDLIEQKGTILIDVRTEDEYATGHLENSANIPLNKIPMFLKRFDKDQIIVVYCRSGNRSAQAEAGFKRNGFTNVYNAGGFESLKKEEQRRKLEK